ncbi:MAG TPA: aldo/keto reductase [Candidatus Binatia bacterium]
MDYITLGRTGLKASVAGLGCGGPSRLGLRDNKSEKECAALVRQAFDLGVNFLDTAEVYGTEEIVGQALAALPREQVIISTKMKFPPDDKRDPPGEVRKSLERSLKSLGTDYVDIYHVHGVEPGEYEFAATEILPALLRLREEGKVRFIGVTEAFVDDMSHRMLEQAVEDGHWDVVMVGFNLLNQSARQRVFARTLEAGAGTLVMFAVRKALSRPERLGEVWDELKKKGLLNLGGRASKEPLGFLLGDGKASSIVDAAYRFCRHEPGAHVVLTGTGSADHLKQNIESLNKPPLPAPAVARLKEIFAQVDCVTGN